MSTHSTHGIVLGLSFTLLLFYLAVKAAQFWSKLCAWKASTRYLFQKYSYGTRPTTKDMMSAGSTCSICYADYRDAVKLSCNHIFCEDCISIWFDKEKTCPMCRAAVSEEDTTWKCGSTSWMVQLF